MVLFFLTEYPPPPPPPPPRLTVETYLTYSQSVPRKASSIVDKLQRVGRARGKDYLAQTKQDGRELYHIPLPLCVVVENGGRGPWYNHLNGYREIMGLCVL